MKTGSYTDFLDAAHRLAKSKVGSDEYEFALDELARAPARFRGVKVPEQGGGLASCMALLRRNRAS